MTEEPEPWADHASNLKRTAAGAEILTITVRFPAGRKRTLGVVANDDGVLVELRPGGLAESAGLTIGDCLLEIDGHIMDGESMANSRGSQVAKLLSLICSDPGTERIEFLVRRPPPAALAAAASQSIAEIALATTGWKHAATQTIEVEEEMPAVVLSNVTFGYDKAVGAQKVLEDVSLSIPAGAKVGLLGRSGCGKSTLLKLMSRVYQPEMGGTIRYFGEPLNEVPRL